jgi:RNA polymerase sigma factor (sigma-70 family)
MSRRHATRGERLTDPPAPARSRLCLLSGQPEGNELLQVYRDNVHAVYAFFTYSVSHETAEDLTATTFERVVRAWSGYDPDHARPRTWIMAIARNLLTDHFRRQSHRAAVSLDGHPALAASLTSGDDPAASCMSQDVLRDWLERLRPREREVLALRFGADLPPAEIARQLGLSEGNVYQISCRSLRRLHDQLPRSELIGNA